MSTTVRVSLPTHDALDAVKRHLGAASADQAIQALIAHWTPDAATLYRQNRRAVRAACKKHGITRLVAFGSRVRDDRRPDSDLDLAIELPDATMFTLARAQADLERAFGVQVDIGTMPEPGSRLGRVIDQEGVVLVP